MTIENKYYYNFKGIEKSEIVTLKNGTAFFASRIENKCFIYFFCNGIIKTISHLHEEKQGSIRCFVIENNPIVILSTKYLLFFKHDFSSFKKSKIKNFKFITSPGPSTGKATPMYLKNNPGVTDTNFIIIPISDYKSQRLAVLNVNTINLTGKWISKSNKLFQILKYNSDFQIELNHEDYPISKFKTKTIVTNNTLIKNNEIYIYTVGHRRSSYGRTFTSLAKVNSKFELKEHIFLEDYVSLKDQKFRNKEGIFSSDLKYCIITPKWKNSDSWKGKQKFYNLKSGVYNNVHIFKGFKGLKLIDINGDNFWYKGLEVKTDKFVYLKITKSNNR